MIEYLPYEQIYPIYSFCATHDLINIACTSKLLYESVKECLWENVEIPWKVLAGGGSLRDDKTNVITMTNLKYTKVLLFTHRGGKKTPETTTTSSKTTIEQNFKTILESCQPSRLRTLKLHASFVSANVIETTTIHLHKLQKISFYNCKDIDSNTWSLLQNLHHLRELVIDNCNFNYDDFKLIINETSVEELSLSRCNIGEDRNLKNLEHSVYFKSLKLGEDMGHLLNGGGTHNDMIEETLNELVLDSEDISNGGDSCLDITRLRRLHKLTLNDAYNDKVDQYILENISKLTSLESLCITRCNNLGESCFSFPSSRGFNSLRMLDVSYCSTLSDDEVFQISKIMTSLQHLNLLSTGITDVGLCHIKNLKKLKTLNLRFCIMITDSGIVSIGEMVCLQKLYLGGCNSITDKALAHINKLPLLHQLELRFCTKLTDTGVESIVSLGWIEKLNISSCHKISDAALTCLVQLPFLKNLNMSFLENLSDEGLKDIKEMKSLQKLNINNCETISDVGVMHISKSKSLRCLKMAGCQKITDLALTFLVDLKLLKMADISSCIGITTEGVTRNLSHLAYLVVIF